MKFSFEGSVFEFNAIVRGGPAKLGDAVPLPPPGDPPGPGMYLQAILREANPTGGITSTPCELLLPNPGGDIGWTPTTNTFYVV